MFDCRSRQFLFGLWRLVRGCGWHLFASTRCNLLPHASDLSYSLVPLLVLQLFATGLGFSSQFTLLIAPLHAEKKKWVICWSVCMLHRSYQMQYRGALPHRLYFVSCFVNVTSISSSLFNESVLEVIPVFMIIVFVCCGSCFVFYHTVNRREYCGNTI